ncbi:MAG: DUF1295 domain-containing protein [Candidatus Paceibacterota bacterium]
MNYFIVLAIVVFFYMTFWFVISLIKKRNDVADVAWGLGFVFLAWISLAISQNFEITNLLIDLLVTIWGLRLSYHIYQRHRKGGEDYRYFKYRKTWGKWFYIRSFLQVYILQGLLLFIIATPILIANKFSTEYFGLFQVLGLLIWITGFYFESVADAQLARFIKDPANKGKLMMQGLWEYSRHPNYFGEVLQWLGIWVMVLSLPYGLWGVVSPLVITFLILKVSGIPMLEEKMSEHPDFAEYKKKVSCFIPLPPKRSSSQ